MQELNQRLSFMDNLSIGIQIIDFQYRYLYLNQKILNEVKMQAEDLIGKTMMDAFPQIEKKDMFKLITESLEKKVTNHLKNEFVMPNGERTFYELVIEPIEYGVIIFTQNITEQEKGKILLQESNKILEDKVKMRTQELAQFNSKLEQLVYDRTIEVEHFAHLAAHDLKHPASIILSYSSLLKEFAQESDTTNIMKAIDVIENNAKKMLNMIDGFRALSKVAGNNLSVSEVHLGDFFNKCLINLEFDKKNINFINTVNCKIYAYPDLLEILFNNLLANILKHANINEKTLVYFTQIEGTNTPTFSLKNTFNEKIDASELLKPFIRNNKKVAGMGLGLSICKKVIAYHDGSIEVKSDGKTFEVIFSFELKNGLS